MITPTPTYTPDQLSTFATIARRSLARHKREPTPALYAWFVLAAYEASRSVVGWRVGLQPLSVHVGPAPGCTFAATTNTTLEAATLWAGPVAEHIVRACEWEKAIEGYSHEQYSDHAHLEHLPKDAYWQGLKLALALVAEEWPRIANMAWDLAIAAADYGSATVDFAERAAA